MNALQNILIFGAGTDGLILLGLLQNQKILTVKAIIDTDEKAPGIVHAKNHGIAYDDNWSAHLMI